VRKKWTVGLLSLVVLVGGCDGRDEPPAAPPNVLLLTIDTLRADHLGCYGHRLETSPNIDALAGRGVRFADCSVQWPKTWPSMASMLTGSYPRTTGVRIKLRALHPELTLLSEIFQGAGYRTAAVVSNYNLGTRFGYDRGFEHFVESWQEGWGRESGEEPFVNKPGMVKRYTDARIVTDQGLAWLAGLEREAPFFLWLHYMDPHGPYVPPAGYESHFRGAYESQPTSAMNLPRYQIQNDPASGRAIADMGFYRTQYDREVRFLDDEIGRLLEEMEGLGIDPRETLIVFTADHGESFDEHGYYLEHGKFSYQACAQAPLIVVQEGGLPAGRVVEPPVGLIDVTPTILELAGLTIPESFEGQSLAALARDDPGAGGPEQVFMEAGFREPTQLTVREGRWKLISVRSEEDLREMTGSPYELYDVVADPGERENLAERHPDVVERLGGLLQVWQAGGQRVLQGEEVDPETLDPQAREMLRSLGYVE